MQDCLSQFQSYYIQDNNVAIYLLETNLHKIYNNHFLLNNGYIFLSKNEINFFMYNVCKSYITQPHLLNKDVILMINAIHLKTHKFFILPLKHNISTLCNFKNINKIRIYSSIMYAVNYTIGHKIYCTKLKLYNCTNIYDSIRDCSSVYHFTKLLNCVILKQSGQDVYHAPYYFMRYIITQINDNSFYKMHNS